MQYYIEKSRAGAPTLCAIVDERKIYLHSKYNPETEAYNIVAKYEIKKYDHIIILGLGLGYVLKEIYKQSDPISQIYVVEKDEKIFSIFKEFNHNLLNLYRIKFLINQAPVTVTNSVFNRFDIGLNKGLVVIETPSITKLYSEYYTDVKKRLQTSLDKVVGLQMTTAKLWNCMMQNFLKNLMQIEKFNILKFNKERVKEKYAVIVSAGPSLEKDIEYLKEIKKNVYIFSVDTALRYLLYNKIIPDFIFSVDPQYQSKLHFENANIPEDTYIVLDIFSNFLLPRKLKNVALILSDNFISQKIFLNFKWTLEPSGGSVTNFIFQFVIKAGFENIIFTGLDLCYPERKMYIPCTYITDYWLKRINRFSSIGKFYFKFYKNRAKAEIIIDNKKFRTSHSMVGYYKWLKDKLCQNRKNVYISENSIAQFEGIKRINLENFKISSLKEKIWIEEPMNNEYILKNIKDFYNNENIKNKIVELLFYSKYFEKLKSKNYEKELQYLKEYIHNGFAKIISQAVINQANN